MSKTTEKDRLDFVEKRDGLEAAIKFAEQGIAIYAQESIKAWKYKEAIDTYIAFIKKHGKTMRLVVIENEKDTNTI